MSQNKEWKSFVEQLLLLRARGLQVDNEAAALDYLERIGYYRLSGYWYSFRQLEISQDSEGTLSSKRLDSFIEGSHFEDAVKLYVFDKKLRLLALDALERIELSLRVDVAHVLGELNAHAHEEPSLFHGNFSIKRSPSDGALTKHEVWLKKYQLQLRNNKRLPLVEHYQRLYGHLPIWVAIEIWDFGMLSKLFAGMQYKHREHIAAKYGAKDGKMLAGWLRGLNFIRNVSAHHSRLWNTNILERASLPQDDAYWQRLNNARPFFYFCLMQKMMRIICPNSSWSERFDALMAEFPNISSEAVGLADFGLQEDWKTWDLWR